MLNLGCKDLRFSSEIVRMLNRLLAAMISFATSA